MKTLLTSNNLWYIVLVLVAVAILATMLLWVLPEPELAWVTISRS